MRHSTRRAVPVPCPMGRRATLVALARATYVPYARVTKGQSRSLTGPPPPMTRTGVRTFFDVRLAALSGVLVPVAEETAHEEVADRPSVHRVIRELVTSVPPSMRRDVADLATDSARVPTLYLPGSSDRGDRG
jgi:hypothetical protein